jgi:hypothetical protein
MKSEISNPWDRDSFDYFDSPFGSIKEDRSSPFEAFFNQVDNKREDVYVFNKVPFDLGNEEVLGPFAKNSACTFSFEKEENIRYFKTDGQNTMAHTFGRSRIASWNFDENLTKHHHDEASEQGFNEDKFPLEVLSLNRALFANIHQIMLYIA